MSNPTTSLEVGVFFLYFDAVLVNVGRCNSSVSELLGTLLLAKVALRDPRSRSAKLGVDEVSDAIDAIALAYESISHLKDTRPFVFCGMHDTTPLLRAFMGAATAMLSLIAASAGYSMM